MNLNHFEQLVARYPCLKVCQSDLEASLRILIECYAYGGKLLVCGNGGSCADAQHIVGELMKGFLTERKLSESQRRELFASYDRLPKQIPFLLQNALPTISLCEESALNSAFANDVAPEAVFAQQVWGYGFPGDVFLGISTSGNSQNVYYAASVAKAKKMKVIGLTGELGGLLSQCSDVCICVPEKETFKVQELHLPIYHALCAQLEQYFFCR